MKSVAALIPLLMLTTGCAFITHNADVLIDQPQCVQSSAAKSTTIRLSVVDERDETDVGRRGAGIAAAKVTADTLMPKFTQAVQDGFRAKGFTLTTNRASADAELLVALRTFRFEESMGFFTVGAEADATILAEAERGDSDYRTQYRASDEDRQLAVSFGLGIDEQLNLVLNSVLMQLFSDKSLESFLTGK